MSEELKQLAMRLNNRLVDKGLIMASAESCTGGWIAKTMTDVPGSSACFDRAFITYSNEAKHEMLGVSLDTLDRQGAVSEAVVLEMVQGALDRSRASLAIAVSGIAGPGGGTVEKPVGTVWLAWSVKGMDAISRKERFSGDRNQVRHDTVLVALKEALDLIG